MLALTGQKWDLLHITPKIDPSGFDVSYHGPGESSGISQHPGSEKPETSHRRIGLPSSSKALPTTRNSHFIPSGRAGMQSLARFHGPTVTPHNLGFPLQPPPLSRKARLPLLEFDCATCPWPSIFVLELVAFFLRVFLSTPQRENSGPE